MKASSGSCTFPHRERLREEPHGARQPNTSAASLSVATRTRPLGDGASFASRGATHWANLAPELRDAAVRWNTSENWAVERLEAHCANLCQNVIINIASDGARVCAVSVCELTV